MTKKSNWTLALYSLFLSFLFLGLCSKNSPLYPMNDWGDVNCFFTMGKSMLHGMVPYRDLYEQKGPILYFVYALAALISQHSFLGAYILDALSFAAFLYIGGQCARLYLGQCPQVYPVVALLAALLCATEASAHGGSVEQMCLWLLLLPLYLINRAICQNRLLTRKEAFVIGILCGICLYVKFTFLGFFFGLALFVLVWYWLFDKQPKALPAAIGSFLGGIAAVSLPIFAYFLVQGALGDFLTAYFYNNLFLYQKQEMSRLYFYVFYLYTSIRRNALAAIPILLGGLWLLVTVRKNYKMLTVYGLSALFLTFAVLFGGVFFIYYPMIFMVFTVYGLIAPALLIQKAWAKIPALSGKMPRPLTQIIGNALLVAVLMVYAFHASSNIYLLDVEKEELPQYRFAAHMNQAESPTLLNYGFLDGGFYFAADILPTNRFFCRLNINLEEMDPAQNQQVEAGLVDFVVTQNLALEDADVDSSHYALADCMDMYLEGDIYTYRLYEKIN